MTSSLFDWEASSRSPSWLLEDDVAIQCLEQTTVPTWNDVKKLSDSWQKHGLTEFQIEWNDESIPSAWVCEEDVPISLLKHVKCHLENEQE